jgi:site-specific recombinase XerD
MSGKSTTLKLESGSPMAALHLAYSGPGRLHREDPLAPVKLYLGSLTRGGARGQRVKLVKAVRLLTDNRQAGLADFDWRALRSTDVEHVRGRLRLEGYAPATINSTLSALKGVALRAWRLEQLAVQELEKIRDVSGVRGDHRARAGRSLSASEISSLFQVCDLASETAAGARDAALLTLLYAGGLRLSEAVRLELTSWDARRHELRVHGKGDRDRTVHFLDGGARRCINQWLRRRGRTEGPLLCPVTN